METFLIMYMTATGIALSFIAYIIVRNDESVSKKFAKVRVRTNEGRRNRPMNEAPEEEYDTQPNALWIVIGASLVLIAMLLGNA